MDEYRWERAKASFEQAQELDDEARERFVDTECAGNDALRAEVRSLLAWSRDDDFLEESPGLPPIVADAADPMIGRLIGAYRLESLIGQGGARPGGSRPSRTHAARDARQ